MYKCKVYELAYKYFQALALLSSISDFVILSMHDDPLFFFFFWGSKDDPLFVQGKIYQNITGSGVRQIMCKTWKMLTIYARRLKKQNYNFWIEKDGM